MDIYGAVFLRSFVQRLHLPASLGSTGITPLLRYYGGSVTSRAQFFGPSTDHERCSFPGSLSLIHIAPTSDHSISNHPMHSYLLLTVLSRDRSRNCRFPFTGRTVSDLGFATQGQARQCILAESSSTMFCLWTGLSLPVALHPASRRRSYLQLRTDQCFCPIGTSTLLLVRTFRRTPVAAFGA
jgi:hypothetical protein